MVPRIGDCKENRAIPPHKHILLNISLLRRLFGRQTAAPPRTTVRRTIIGSIIRTRALVLRVFYYLPITLRMARLFAIVPSPLFNG